MCSPQKLVIWARVFLQKLLFDKLFGVFVRFALICTDYVSTILIIVENLYVIPIEYHKDK